MTQPLLVVVGATGVQGRSIINYFIKHEPDYKLRGLTRSLRSEAAQELSQSGVEMAIADYNDLDSLLQAFKDADYIFASTDYAAQASSAAARAMVDRGEARSVAEAAGLLEENAGRNIANAAAQTASLKRLVFSTTANAAVISDGKYHDLYELSSKARIYEHMQNTPGLRGKINALYVAFFSESLVRFSELIGWTKGTDGQYLFRVAVDPDALIPWIDMENDAGQFVTALLRGPAGLALEGTSFKASFDEIARLLQEELDVQVKVKKMSDSDYDEMPNSEYMRTVSRLLLWLEEYGTTANNADIMSPDKCAEQTGLQVKLHGLEGIAKLDWNRVL